MQPRPSGRDLEPLLAQPSRHRFSDARLRRCRCPAVPSVVSPARPCQHRPAAPRGWRVQLDRMATTTCRRARSPSVVTYLEMTGPPRPQPLPEPPELALRRVERPDLAWYRDLYRRIGTDWLWFSRLVMPDDEVRGDHRRPAGRGLCTARDGRDEGLLELDRREPPDIELAYFGLTPEHMGQGAGRWLMRRAIELAWRASAAPVLGPHLQPRPPGRPAVLHPLRLPPLSPGRRGRGRPAPARPRAARFRRLAAAHRGGHREAAAGAGRHAGAGRLRLPDPGPSAAIEPARLEAAPTASIPATSRCSGRSTTWASRTSSAGSTRPRRRWTSTPPHPRPRSVDVVVETASLDTRLPDLDATLRGSGWFDTASLPAGRVPLDRHRGHRRRHRPGHRRSHAPRRHQPVTLDVTFNGGANNLLTGRYTLGFAATGTLKRSEFGLTNLVPAVGDEVSSRSRPSSAGSSEPPKPLGSSHCRAGP